MNYREEFVMFMVRAGVLTFGEFVTKSGRNTPYFINTGNYKTGKQIGKLGEFYADCIMENINNGKIDGDLMALFGPAYKGIPLSVTTAISMSSKHEKNLYYTFNRKEEKDHGEGGSMVGYKLQDKDKVLIVEDVITAGTAIRECFPILKKAANVQLLGLIISVDRMEKGTGEKTAIQEIKEDFAIETFPIVTIKDIIKILHNKEVDGKIYIDDSMKAKIEDYMEKYCI